MGAVCWAWALSFLEVFEGGHHGASAEAGAVVVAEAEGLLAVFVAEELDGGLPVGPEDADFLDDLALAPGELEGSWEFAVHGAGLAQVAPMRWRTAMTFSSRGAAGSMFTPARAVRASEGW